MTTPRQIRAAVVARLLALGGFNVYNHRATRIDPRNLPAVNIVSLAGTADKTPDEGAYNTTTQIAIILSVAGDDNPDASLTGGVDVGRTADELFERVLTEFFSKWETLGQLVYRFNYAGFSEAADASSEIVIHHITMNFNAITHDATTE